MMVTQQRMSPFTALFLAVGFIGVSAIGAGTVITLYAVSVADEKASGLLGLTRDAVTNLPEIIDNLPPPLADMLHDRRAPEYAANIVTSVRLAEDPASGLLVPSLEIVNNGEEVLSMLGVRVTLHDHQGAALYEWNQLAAAPAVIDDLPGPLLPGTKRYIVLPGRRGLTKDLKGQLTSAVELSEIRVWEPVAQRGTALAGGAIEALP